jgi:hypothetical protein
VRNARKILGEKKLGLSKIHILITVSVLLGSCVYKGLYTCTHIRTYMHAYTQTHTEVCSWINGVCIPDNWYKLGCVMLFMFKNNLTHLLVHQDDTDMKIRTYSIMKFVYSHNVIMYWNNMKPRLLMLHFTPAVSTTTVTRENKTCRCPWQRHFAQAQFTLLWSAIERICFLKCEW